MCVFLAGAIRHLTTQIIGVPGDTSATIWQVRWEYYSILHHGNMFISPDILVPFGADVAWCAPLLAGLLAFPIELLTRNLVLVYNLLLLLCWAFSGFAAYIMTEKLTGRRLTAYVSGIVFVTSTYFIGHALGHLTLVMAFGIPLFVASLYASFLRWSTTADGGHLQWKGIFSLSVTLFLATQSAYDYGLYAIELGGVMLLFYGFESRYAFVKSRVFLLEATISGLIFVVLMVPSIYYLLFSPLSVGAVGAASGISTPYVSDLLTFFTPSPYAYLFSGHFPSFTGGQAEYSGFLGYIPILGIVYVMRRHFRQNIHARAWTGIFVVFAVLSLGPVLHVNGISTGVILPEALLQKTPIFDITLPVRFNLLVMLSAGVLTGIAAESFHSRLVKHPQNKYTMGYVSVVSLLIIVPNVPLKFPTYAPDYGQALKFSGTALQLPVTIPSTNFYNGDAGYLYGQAISDFSYSIPEGYLSRLPSYIAEYVNNNVLYQDLANIQTNPSDLALLKQAGSLVPYYDRLMNITHVVIRESQLTTDPGTYVRDMEYLFGNELTHEGTLDIIQVKPSDAIPTSITVNSQLAPMVLGRGWSAGWSQSATEWVWSTGTKSTLFVPKSHTSSRSVQVRLAPFLYTGHDAERIVIKLNGSVVKTVQLTKDQWVRIPLPISPMRTLPNQLEFDYGSVAMPSEVIPGSLDRRKIAVRIAAIRFGKAP